MTGVVWLLTPSMTPCWKSQRGTSDFTFDRSIWRSGEYREPARSRLWSGQSTTGAGARICARMLTGPQGPVTEVDTAATASAAVATKTRVRIDIIARVSEADLRAELDHARLQDGRRRAALVRSVRQIREVRARLSRRQQRVQPRRQRGALAQHGVAVQRVEQVDLRLNRPALNAERSPDAEIEL